MVQSTRFRPWVGRTLQLNLRICQFEPVVESTGDHVGNYTSATFFSVLPLDH